MKKKINVEWKRHPAAQFATELLREFGFYELKPLDILERIRSLTILKGKGHLIFIGPL